MSEKKDGYTEAKSQMRLSERITAALPGFRGYKEKELRRESDRIIRNHLALKLSKGRDNVKSISQKIADKRYLDVLADIDHLSAKMDRITEKVNHATYGYTGFFNIIKIKEENLDHMIDFDNQIVDGVNTLTSEIDVFKTQLLSGDYKNLKVRVQTVSDKLELLEDAFDKRQEEMLGVTV